MQRSIVGLSVTLLLAGVFTGSNALAQSGPPHVFRMGTDLGSRDSVSNQTITSNLINHGGPVLQSSSTYAVLWGSQTAFPSDLQSALPLFFGGFGSSVYSNILDQYLPSAASSSFGAAIVKDATKPPSSSPSVSTIVNEACKEIKAGVFPLEPIDSTNNSGGVYIIFASNFPRGINYCGWHSYGTCEGAEIAVSYIPNLKNITGCNPGNLFNANSYSEGTRADVNVVAHELSEATSDPALDAWYDSGGYEIGDKCAWMFTSSVTLMNKTTWQLQEEWSNSVSGCVQEQSTP